MSSAVKNNYAAARDEDRGSAEILIRPDGRILVHNLTPAVAALLARLAPHDADMRRRATLPALRSDSCSADVGPIAGRAALGPPSHP